MPGNGLGSRVPTPLDNHESGAILPLALVVLLMWTVLLNGLVVIGHYELTSTHQEYTALQARYLLRNELESYWAELGAQSELIEGQTPGRHGVCLRLKRLPLYSCEPTHSLQCQAVEASAQFCDERAFTLVLRRGGWWVKAGKSHRLFGQYWRWD